MPPIDLTASIQRPLFGSDSAKPASTQNRMPIPIAYVNSSEPPPTTLPVVDTNASKPARNGPVHGAAIKPPTSPIANAPPKPLPPIWLSFACRLDGKLRSNAPNIDAASARNNPTSGNTIHGFASWVPKSPALPSIANVTPSTEYVTPMPPTYAVARPIARRRVTLSPRAPKIASVIGIIGYTHGVSEVRKPNPNAARNIQPQ